MHHPALVVIHPKTRTVHVTRPRVIIEISPSRVEVGVLKGKAVERWRSKRFARSDWPSAQTEVAQTPAPGSPGFSGMPGRAPAPAPQAPPADAVTLLHELEVQQPRATVIYHARGTQSELASCAASINLSHAEQAARLAMSNLADFPIDDAPVDTCTLLIDAPGKADGAPARQRHTLVAGDAEHRCAALGELLRAGGITVERLIPAEAVAIADAVRTATSEHSGDAGDTQVTAALFIGEHATTLAVGTPGRLTFVRTIATGTEILAEALTRSLRPRSHEDALVNLGHSQARALLLEAGIPAPDAIIPSQPTLAGSALLPHLQPLLQRMAVELKQSLRFGVTEAQRPNVRILAMGPGAAVPALGDAFAKLSGFSLARLDEPLNVDAQDSSIGGLIAGLVRSPACTIALLPETERARNRQQGLRRAMILGACVAAAYIGFEALDARAELSKTRSHLQSIQAQAQAEHGPALVRQRAIESRRALAAVESRVRTALGESPDAAALWQMLANSTSPELRILSLGLSRQAPAPGAEPECTVALRAYVRLSESPDPASTIKDYLDRLAAVPLVKTVRLGGAQRITVNGHDAQVFDAVLVPVAMTPPSARFDDRAHPHSTQSASAEENRP
jgi:Tfp pilus assembly PilM family ATPase